MIKAILFDLDETLLDRNASIQLFLEEQYHRFAEPLAQVPFEEYRERFLLYDEHGYVAKEIVYARLVEEFKLAIDPAQLVDDFYTISYQPLLFPGTVTLLQVLRAASYKLGIITNGSIRTQQSKLDKGGLMPLVDVALISEAEGIRKPEAELFLRATRQLDVEPHECVMVGDNPTADIGGALALGMKTVWRRGHLPWPDNASGSPHFTITTIADLHNIDWQAL